MCKLWEDLAKEYAELVTKDIAKEMKEEVTEEVKREVTEELTKEVTEKVSKEKKEENKKQTAIKMLSKKKYSFEEIADISELSIEEIKQLAEKYPA